MATKEAVKKTPVMTKLMGGKKVSTKKETASDVLTVIDKIDSSDGESLVTLDVDDLLVKDYEEIATLKEDKAFKMVTTLLSDLDHNSFKLGGVLSRINAEGWFMDKGFENFAAYIESETDIGYRKAMYLINIYNGLLHSGIKWGQVAHIGWTKLKDLAVHLTPDNIDQWLLEIDGLTAFQVQDLIKSKTAADKKIGDTEVVGKKTVTISFKLHEDQKETVKEAIAKAKHESGTMVDSVALEFICLDFLSGSKGTGVVKSLKQLMAEKTVEEILELFSSIWPDVEMEVTIP
jgi:hypothetical protein